MGNSKLIHSFFFFVIIFSCYSSSFGSIHKCPDEQRDALLVFKQNISSVNESYDYIYYGELKCRDLNGYNRYDPIRMNWKTSIDCCDWDGITCNNFTGDVISLKLTCGKLQGVSKLDILLSGLPKLAAIDLSYSGLSVVTRNDVRHVNYDLYELSLASCNLTVFPDFLRAMKHLRILDLSSNYISGQIPAWVVAILGNNLTYLDLSENSITSMPQLIKSDGLEYLYLQSNLLQGSFPSWICNMKHLKYLDVSNNSISGTVPLCLQNMSSSLVSLNVKLNMIQGPFPTAICNIGSLLYLDMSYNNFHGVIPQCFGNMTSSLKMVNLRENKFHGTIPQVSGYCGLVDGLILNGNKLEGDVPRSLENCKSLKVLDLGHNQLTGTFPHWLGYLQKLQVLILGSNNLHGTIETPSAIEFLFPSLSIFDISSNGFVGRLPEKYFESFNAIKDVDKEPIMEHLNFNGFHNYYITLVPEGARLSYSSILQLVTVVDLSSNKFEGEIPNVIGNLISLRWLNLSNNNLNGQIPHVLANLLDIESLDLSSNHLEGEIPQSLVRLSTLTIFNVSQNHLVGRLLDLKAQFATFTEDSYLGNPGLCGPPLTKKCEDLSSPQVEAKGEEWIYVESVMSGLGFGTLVGVVLGYGMLSTGKPKWLHAIVETGVHTKQKKRKQVHIRKRN